VSWRAFIIGLLAVVAVSLVEVYSGVVHGYGGITSTCLPPAAVLVLVLLAVGVNPLIKLVRRAWAFRQAERASPCESDREEANDSTCALSSSERLNGSFGRPVLMGTLLLQLDRAH